MFGDSLSLEKFFFGIHFEYKTQIIAYPIPKIESVDGGVRITFQRNNQGYSANSREGSLPANPSQSRVKSRV